MDCTWWRQVGSLLENLHNFRDLRNRLTQLPLNPHLERHGAAGAGAAGALEANLDDRSVDFHHFHVAAIGHQVRAQFVQRALHVLDRECARVAGFSGVGGLCGGGGAGVAAHGPKGCCS